jgi:hypothetical protein
MDKEALEDLLNTKPFVAFRINTNGGQTYEVHNPSLVHQLKTQVFFAFPDSDRFAIIPLRNISSVEILESAA